MKKALFVIACALVLTFICATGAFATTGKFFTYSTSYYKWSGGTIPQDTFSNTARTYASGSIPGTSTTVRLPNSLSLVGSNPSNPGVHANYLATTAKCGICHSVHRAVAGGVKLLPTSDASCAGCHTGGTAITSKIITWGTLNMNWRAGDSKASAWAFGGPGPHNDALDTLYGDGEWDGISTPVPPSYDVGPPFARYGCATRRCHSTNPHGANSSQYTIFSAKLLFNDSPADDDATNPDLVAAHGAGTYGGLDATYDNLGATDASVQRFADANPGIITLSGGNILINGAAPDANETHALVAGLTCGRPSNVNTGEDECHAEATYAIVDKGIRENRNHATGAVSPNALRTDNTQEEALGFGGNDNRDWKTGHVAGSFAATPTAGSYSPIAGCTSCHDQTDAANTVTGNFTFPHGQTATGDTNIYTYQSGGTVMAKGYGNRVRIWSGFAGTNAATLLTYIESSTVNPDGGYANQKAFDGQCLKCHRDGAGNGIGLTK